MIQLDRRPLPDKTVAYLARQTARVTEKKGAERQAEAARRWRSKSPTHTAAMQNALTGMCSGLRRCMYCEDSAATDIDHFDPKARSPLLTFEWLNMLAACSYCNSNEKRDAFPRDDRDGPLLIDPTSEDPADHLVYSPSTGRYVAAAESSKGDPSIGVFGLNRELLTRGRLRAWELMEAGVLAYGRLMDEGDVDRAARIAAAVQLQPFGGVLRAFLKSATSAGRVRLSGPTRDVLATYPEIFEWRPAVGGR